jgi:hypothetical protein
MQQYQVVNHLITSQISSICLHLYSNIEIKEKDGTNITIN